MKLPDRAVAVIFLQSAIPAGFGGPQGMDAFGVSAHKSAFGSKQNFFLDQTESGISTLT